MVSCKGLKGSMFDRMDPFVMLELRKGREVKVRGLACYQIAWRACDSNTWHHALAFHPLGCLQTSTKSNEENPVWNEEFDIVVDSPVRRYDMRSRVV